MWWFRLKSLQFRQPGFQQKNAEKKREKTRDELPEDFAASASSPQG